MLPDYAWVLIGIAMWLPAGAITQRLIDDAFDPLQYLFKNNPRTETEKEVNIYKMGYILLVVYIITCLLALVKFISILAWKLYMKAMKIIAGASS